MTVVVIAEKPSAARNMAKALGGATGSYQGQSYVITSLRGHLYEFKDPSAMVPASLSAQYKGWELDNLPWDHRAFSWEREPREGARDTIAQVRKALGQGDEITIATDVDPSGEGGLLAVEVLLELGLEKSNKKFTRMYFTDEAPASIQKAFMNRKPIPDLLKFDEFLMADTRSKYDMLTMQFTRVSTKVASQQVMLRQGRLKSAMVKIVGDGLKAYNDYVKKPFFQNRFKDENGVVYTNPEEPQFAKKEDVPGGYHGSKVILDSRENKRTAPPKLLDLAGLSSILAGRGVKAAVVLSTYQKMYEDQVVSYPRTEDRVITPEQYNEMLPKVDAIAKVVGADAKMLTHRTARSTHVKTGGAHGANRPGTNVPASLSALDAKYGSAASMIYETLAKNFLAIFAEDYVYEQQKGHVEDYPKFVGTANLPKSLGWKGIFDDEAEPDEDESTAGLGTKAEPFIHEGANTRPPHPTMKWLMTQLEKRDVGTGATRTSIYADVTNEKSKAPLLREARGKLTMAEAGQMSYLLLPGTHIGDLAMTERLMSDMKEVAKGAKTADEVLAPVAQMVRDDIETMKRNAKTMFAELGLTEVVQKSKASGTWNGQQVSFNSEWSGHKFTQSEIDDLLAGKTIELTDCVSAKTGSTFGVKGKLSVQTFKGKKYVGFENLGFLDGGGSGGGGGSIPAVFCKHKFTAAEIKKLEAGEQIHVKGLVSKAGKKFDANIKFDTKPGEDRKSLILSFN